MAGVASGSLSVVKKDYQKNATVVYDTFCTETTQVLGSRDIKPTLGHGPIKEGESNLPVFKSRFHSPDAF